MPLLRTRGTTDGGYPAELVGDLTMQVLRYLGRACGERSRRRQREGIDAALARGVRFGHEPMEIPEGFDEVHEAYLGKEMTRRQCADALGVSPATFDRWRKRRGAHGG